MTTDGLLKIWIHFIADFVFQSDWMAINKGKNSIVGAQAMLVHIAIYTSVLLIVFDWRFASLNGLLHLATDMATSRLTSYLWINQKRHWFFVVIGFDQAIHLSCLVIL